MLQTAAPGSGSKTSSYDSLRDRFIAGFGVDEPERAQWPARHLVGLDNHPVPFHIGQELTFDSQTKITAMIAGSQGGKTSLGPWWIYEEIKKWGRGDYMIVTSSYPLFQRKLLPATLQVFEQILGIGRYWSGDRIIEIKNPYSKVFEAKKSTDPMYARIIMGSASAPNTLESATAKAAWLDEAGQDEFTLAAYRAIERRLRLRKGRQLLTTTLYNLGWVKTAIIDMAQKGGRVKKMSVGKGSLTRTVNEKADITLIQFDSILNPEFSLEEFKDAQEKMPDDEFKMFYRGQTTKLRSMIYDILSDDAKIREPLEQVPAHWPRAIGVDPVGQKTASVYLAWDPENGQLHIYDEFEGEYGKTLSEHGIDILDRLRTHGAQQYICYGGQPAENQARLDIGGSGLVIHAPPISSVWSGIDKVYELIKTDTLILHSNCERLISDLMSMRRKKDKRTGLLTDEIENKNIWHLPDALRYIIVGLVYTDGSATEEVRYNPIRIGY